MITFQDFNKLYNGPYIYNIYFFNKIENSPLSNNEILFSDKNCFTINHDEDGMQKNRRNIFNLRVRSFLNFKLWEVDKVQKQLWRRQGGVNIPAQTK